MKHLYFRVADALFLLQFSESTDIRPLIPSCAPFNIPPVKEVPMFEMTVGHDLVSQEPVGKEIGQFDCGGINHGMYKTEEGYKILISSPEKELSCSMETNEEFSTCRVSLFGDYNNQSFGLNNAMMIAFAFSGAYHDIILMHASVTIYDNKGYLFLGKSGTGKSTIIKWLMAHEELEKAHTHNCGTNTSAAPNSSTMTIPLSDFSQKKERSVCTGHHGAEKPLATAISA